MSHTEKTDLIDRLLKLDPKGTTSQARHFRAKVRTGTQDSYDTLFDPNLSLALNIRWLVAIYACRLSKANELEQHYCTQAQCANIDAHLISRARRGDFNDLDDAQLQAVFEFTRKLIENPIEGDEAALQDLRAVGLSTRQIVILAQLIGFLSYQTRLVAGLKALQNAEEN